MPFTMQCAMDSNDIKTPNLLTCKGTNLFFNRFIRFIILNLSKMTNCYCLLDDHHEMLYKLCVMDARDEYALQ